MQQIIMTKTRQATESTYPVGLDRFILQTKTKKTWQKTKLQRQIQKTKLRWQRQERQGAAINRSHSTYQTCQICFGQLPPALESWLQKNVAPSLFSLKQRTTLLIQDTFWNLPQQIYMLPFPKMYVDEDISQCFLHFVFLHPHIYARRAKYFQELHSFNQIWSLHAKPPVTAWENKIQ